MSNYQKELKALIAQLPGGPIKGWLAGGAITSTVSGKPVNDLDVYFRSEQDFLEACESAYNDGYWCVCFTDRSATFVSGDTVVQFMHFNYFNSPEEIFDSFDFTVCMAAADIETGELHQHPDFMRDVAARRLMFNENTAFPIASGLRVKKYQDRGYTISQGEQLRILLACAALRMESWADVQKQLGGHYGEEVAMDTNKCEYTPKAAITCLDRERPYVKSDKVQPADIDDIKALLKGESMQEFVPTSSLLWFK